MLACSSRLPATSSGGEAYSKPSELTTGGVRSAKLLAARAGPQSATRLLSRMAAVIIEAAASAEVSPVRSRSRRTASSIPSSSAETSTRPTATCTCPATTLARPSCSDALKDSTLSAPIPSSSVRNSFPKAEFVVANSEVE
eukprot:1999490-Rhodomonas_salina.1